MQTSTSKQPLTDKIVNFTLRHVPFDGWTRQSLERGAIDAGIEPDVALRMFDHNIKNVVKYYSTMLDRKMLMTAKKVKLQDMKIRERISKCVNIRLDLMSSNKEAAHKAASFLVLPNNLTLGTKLLFCTVDAMWNAAGDTATDFNYYTKRLLLSGVYSSTLVYWFNDNSEEFNDTKEFLARRIENVMIVPKLKGWVKSVISSQ